MIIKHLDIEGFGVFHNKRIEGLGKGVNVMYGPNEAGKSTLLDFVRFTLFDYPNFLKDRRPPINGGNHGGSILLEHTSGQDLLVHRKGNKQFSMELNGELSDDVSVYSRLINFATEQLFKNIFAITVDELNNLDKLDESGMKDRIFSMGMGLSNVNLGDIEKKFLEHADNYFKGRAPTKKLPTITKELDVLEAKISLIEANIGQYDAFQQEEKALSVSLGELKQEMEELSIQRDKWQNYQKSFAAFTELLQGQQALEELKDVSLIPHEISEQLKEDKKALQRLEDDQTDQQAKLTLIKKATEDIVVNENLLPFHELTDYLTANATKFEDTQDRLRTLENDTKELLASNEIVVKGLGKELTVEQLLGLSDYNQLRALSSDSKEITQQLKNQLAQVNQSRANASEEQGENTRSLDRLHAQLSSHSKSVSQLRDREVELTAIIEGLKRRGGSVATGNRQLLLFALGAIALTVGIGFVNGWFSIVPGALALVFVLLYLRTPKSSVDTPDIDHSALIKERRDLQDELQELTTLTQQKDAAQNNHDTNKQREERLTKEAEDIVGQLDDHSKNWISTLEKYHLPAFILPDQISDLIHTSDRLKSNAQRLEAIQREKETAQEFIEEFIARINPLANLLQRSTDEVTFVVNQLKENVSNWKEKETRRKNITEEDSKLSALVTKRAQIEARMKEVFVEYRATNEAEFYQKVELSDSKLKTEDQVKNARKEIALICGVNEVEQSIEELAQLTKTAVDSSFIRLQEQLDALTEQQKNQTIEIGALRQRISDLLNIDEMYTLQNQREALKAQLEEEYHEWLINKVALAILNKEKQQYEKEKQPSVIKHASAIFEQITHGKYTGLSVSLTDNDVKIHTKTDKTVAIDTLSRGTKEQLLLALRLGFIKAYEEKSEPLPIVLDDVMVNFDNKRAQEFVSLLTDFAENRQAIIFTCHEHLRDLFKAAGARVVEWA